MITMYPPQNNSPHTELSESISTSTTSIFVKDGSILPDAPNVLTIGVDEEAELVLMTDKIGNTLTVERGYNGTTARAFDAETWIYRAITAQDISALQGNLQEHTENGDVHVTAEDKAKWNDSDVFIAQYEVTTAEEINTAIEAGKVVFLHVNSSLKIVPYTKSIGKAIHVFTAVINNVDVTQYKCQNGNWSSSRLSTHASTHATGGTDPITPASIGAAATPEAATALPDSGTALTDNTIYNVSEAVGTYEFAPPASGWAHGRFTTGTAPDITFASGSFVGDVPTFEGDKTYEFDVLNGVWAFAEVVIA